jgi:hypothetical protein
MIGFAWSDTIYSVFRSIALTHNFPQKGASHEILPKESF